ncbi:MAG: DUF2946 family protein [Rhodomicrobium sp.]
MRFRRWVGWIAVAAILLHAATVARHNVILFQAIHAQLASQQGLETGVICHLAAEDGKAQGLPGKDQGGFAKPCPICLGLAASAHALPASAAPPLRVPQTILAAAFVPQDPQLASAARVSLPSNRGPPSLA